MADTAHAVIELDATPATLADDLQSEVARGRRALTEAYQAARQGADFANALLQAHEAFEVIETLAGELSLRGTR